MYNEKMCSKVEQLFRHVTVPFCVVAQNLKKQSRLYFFKFRYYTFLCFKDIYVYYTSW